MSNVTDARIAYKVEHAADLLDCSRAYLYKLIALGKIRTVDLEGRTRRIPHSELERLAGGDDAA